MDTDNRQQVIIGCGYVGQRVARLLCANTACIGITRTQASANAAQEYCSSCYAIDIDEAESLAPLYLKNSSIYYLAPPPPNGRVDTRIEKFLLHCKSQPPEKIVYISTSGVYGDCKGNWVTEQQPISPISERAHRRVDAEQQLTAFCQFHATSLTILRVGGIYGPGRIPITRASQSTVICPQEAPYTNRIHADDLAAICIRAMQSDCSDTFNVSDGNPTTMTDYFYQITDRAGLPRPQCISLDQAAHQLSPGMLSFARESRRLDTKKLHQRLNVKIRYRSLSAGLDSCAKDFEEFQQTSSS